MNKKIVLVIGLLLLILPFVLLGRACTPSKPVVLPPASQPASTPTSLAHPVIPTFTASLPPAGQTAIEAPGGLLIPVEIPAGYALQSTITIQESQQTILSFYSTRPLEGADPALTATTTITLVQSPRNDRVPLVISPSAHVQDILVNGQPAVYTIGAWDAAYMPDPNQGSTGKFETTWRNDLEIQNVYWQEGEIFLVLITGDKALTREILVRMAGSVK